MMEKDTERFEWTKVVVEGVLAAVLLLTALLGYLGNWTSVHEKALLHGAVILLALAGFIALQWHKKWQIRAHAGISKFDPFREHSDDRIYYRHLTTEYTYIGQSFDSNAPDLLDALLDLPRGVSIRILLADLRQDETVRFLWNFSADSSRPALLARLALQQKHVAHSLAHVSNLEIRLCKHGVPFWLHLFDRNRIIFGMLKPRKLAIKAPALELLATPGRYNLFKYFEDLTDLIWMESVPVSVWELADIAESIATTAISLDQNDLGSSTRRGKSWPTNTL